MPRKGTDCGDHPPITPMKLLSEFNKAINHFPTSNRALKEIIVQIFQTEANVTMTHGVYTTTFVATSWERFRKIFATDKLRPN